MTSLASGETWHATGSQQKDMLTGSEGVRQLPACLVNFSLSQHGSELSPLKHAQVSNWALSALRGCDRGPGGLGL